MMNEDIFWQLIADSKQPSAGDSDAQVAALQERLQSLPESEIVEFDSLLHVQLDRSYHRDLWAAAYSINGGCSDDGFDYFRAWLIAQGERVYREALADPETLVGRAAPDATDAESMLYAAGDAYKVETGRDLPARAVGPSEPAGERWDEGDLEHLYP